LLLLLLLVAVVVLPRGISCGVREWCVAVPVSSAVVAEGFVLVVAALM